MPKKSKTPKPLPSVLTVASPLSPKTEPRRQRSSGSPSRAAKASSTPKPSAKPQPTSRRKTAAAPPTNAPLLSGTPVHQQTPATPAPRTVEVTFALVEHQAHHVLLGGTFNNWSTETTPMERLGDGRWQTRWALAPGRHEYKFLVDGQWLPDPNAQEQSSNDYGTINSILEVRA